MIFRKKKKKVVVIGGGTGTYTVLSGLKQHRKDIDLTAIIAMSDSGGSTGRLRDEFGYLPVGDVRMALTALANDGDENEALLRKLFLHRFNKGGEVGGHNFGNLFLVALTDILGGEEDAIEAASRVLRVCGTVVPVTKEKIQLVAEYDDGTVVTGEHEIDEPQKEREGKKIIALKVTPEAKINPRAKEVIMDADLIVLGPGDLYTSILANCVVSGVKEALEDTKGKIVYISNLMTKIGQTAGMGIAEHAREIERYIGKAPHTIIFNNGAFPDKLFEKYEKDGEFPVFDNSEELTCHLVKKDLITNTEVVTSKGDVLKRSLVRHDSFKLSDAIMDLL